MTRATLVNRAENILHGSQAMRLEAKNPIQSIAENTAPSGARIVGMVISSFEAKGYFWVINKYYHPNNVIDPPWRDGRRWPV